MAIGTTVLIVAGIVVLIWVFVELKRFKHKIFAMFLIALILFSYLGFMASIKGQDINFKSIDGLKTAGSLYLSWIGNVFKNMKSITTNAIKMDWRSENKTAGG